MLRFPPTTNLAENSRLRHNSRIPSTEDANINLNIALTGRMASMTQAEAAELIQSLGGRFHARVQKTTDLLVIGQEGWPLRKDGRIAANLAVARRLRDRGFAIEIINEEQFLERFDLREQRERICRRYGLDELARLTDMSRDQIRGWLQSGIIRASENREGLRYFDFQQVATIRALARLTKNGVSAEQLRQSAERFREWLPGAEDVISQLDVVNGNLVVRRPGGVATDSRGQMYFEFSEVEDDEPTAEAEEETTIVLAPFRPVSEESDLFERAVRLEEDDRLAEAATAYQDWLAENGPDAEVCFNLANVLANLGKHEAAIERYRQAVECNSDYAEAWNNLGAELMGRGDSSGAFRAWQRALLADPHYADAVYNLADALDTTGRPRDAKRYWQAYLQLDPHSEWATHARRRLMGS